MSQDRHVRVAGPVVVGVDDSRSCRDAVELATWEAGRRRLALRLVHGYVQPLAYSSDRFPVDASLCYVRDLVTQAGQRLRIRHPDLRVDTAVIAGSPAGVLVEESRTASLVVVGARGHGGFTELLAGSVSTQLAAHAHSPVVVVRPGGEATGPVVVGVDGSEVSDAALGFAFEEASARGVALAVLYAWQALPPDSLGPATRWHDDPVQAGSAARRLLAELTSGWPQQFPDVSVELNAVHSANPAATLLDASAHASLLVMGCRGRGGFTALLLGSVSRAMVHHAHCPVAVIHSHQPVERGGDD